MHPHLRFGIAFFPPNWIELELAEYAETLGFDALWIGEHIAFHIPTFDALTAMAAVAARTTRIGIGIAALLLPLRPAATVAKAAATLDIISNGRLSLGVGVGGEYPKEFEAVGAPLSQRGQYADDAIAILRALWAPGAASYQGQLTQFSDIRMEPKPQQPGGPPILIGGRSERALRRAARLGDGFMPYLYTPAQYAEARQRLFQYAAEAGREEAEWRVPMYQFIYASDRATRQDDEAQRLLATRLQQTYQQPFERVTARYCTAGSPDTCRLSLQTYVDAGVREFILTPPVTSPQEWRQQIDRYATQIIPALHLP